MITQDLDDRLLTVRETAERLRCSELHVRRLLSSGRLTRVKVGHLTRTRASEIRAITSGSRRVV